MTDAIVPIGERTTKHGQPRHFETADEFQEAVIEYIRRCENEWFQYPNIAGFCVFCNMTRETFYKQRDYYPDNFKIVQEIFENSAINSKWAKEAFKMFYMRNKFGYTNDDLMHHVFDAPLQVNVNLDNLSDEELMKFKELTAKAEKK